MPEGIGDVTGLTALRRAMLEHGYDEALIDRICHGNWQDLLGRVLR